MYENRAHTRRRIYEYITNHTLIGKSSHPSPPFLPLCTSPQIYPLPLGTCAPIAFAFTLNLWIWRCPMNKTSPTGVWISTPSPVPAHNWFISFRYNEVIVDSAPAYSECYGDEAGIAAVLLLSGRTVMNFEGEDIEPSSRLPENSLF